MQRVVKRGHARFWTITRIRRADNQNTVKVNWTTFNGFAFRFLVSSNQVMKWILICNDEHEYYTKNGKVTTLIFFNCGCNVYRFNFVWRRFFENWDNTRNKWRPCNTKNYKDEVCAHVEERSRRDFLAALVFDQCCIAKIFFFL